MDGFQALERLDNIHLVLLDGHRRLEYPRNAAKEMEDLIATLFRHSEPGEDAPSLPRRADAPRV